MSETKFKEAKGHLAFSQQLVDQMRQSQMEETPTEQPPEDPQMPQESPQQEPPQTEVTDPAVDSVEPATAAEEPKVEKTGEPKDNTEQFLGIIEDIVATDKLEEERRLKEIEEDHSKEISTIKDRVVSFLKNKRGKKK